MPTYPNQIIASTNPDRHGECMPLSVLEDFCVYAIGKKMPVHQNHDMALPITGHMENLRIEQSKDDPSKHYLLADIELYEGTYSSSWGGFSISAVVMIRKVQDPQALIYLPYPSYNDSDLLDSLQDDPTLNIGKWLKKSDEYSTWAVFGATIAYLLKPAWDDVYKRAIVPVIDRFLATHGARILDRGLHLEHVQLLVFNEQTVEVRFKPAPGKERYCFAHPLLHKGLQLVAKLLTDDPRAISPGVERIVLTYDNGAREYAFTRTEYKDGSVESAA